MLGIAVIGYCGGNTGSIGTGRYGDIAAGGAAPSAGIGPSLHAVPDSIAVFLLELNLD